MDPSTDLVSMADIARLAGQSRSTVGNWKARHADFPPAVSRTSRGPLYDRAEVVRWLERTDRAPALVENLTASVAEIAADGGYFTATAMEDHQDIPAIIALLALRQRCSPGEWEAFVGRAQGTCQDWQEFADLADGSGEDWMRGYLHRRVPVAEAVIDWQQWSPPLFDLWRILTEVSAVAAEDIPETVAGLLDAYLANDARSQIVPTTVRTLMAGLANPGDADVIYQPGPGLGQTLVATAGTGRSVQRLYLQEITEPGAKLASANLDVHGLHATVAAGDVFETDAFAELRADCVVCTPPWDPKVPRLPDTADDLRWVWGEPGVNDGHFAWVQHCLYHLADGPGHAVILLPSSALSGSGRSARIRRRVVKAGLLRAVINLPASALPGSTLRGSVLVFSRTPPEDDWGVLMVDLSDPAQRLDSVLVRQTVDTYRDWIAGGEATGLIGSGATLEDLAANDFILDPTRYQPIVSATPDIEEKMSGYSKLSYRLEALLDAAHHIDEKVRETLVVKK